jgi:hypothetical protein
MSDYRPTQADREAAKAICEQFFIVLGNDERTHKLIAAIIAEKMQPERSGSRFAGGCGGVRVQGGTQRPQRYVRRS